MSYNPNNKKTIDAPDSFNHDLLVVKHHATNIFVPRAQVEQPSDAERRQTYWDKVEQGEKNSIVAGMIGIGLICVIVIVSVVVDFVSAKEILGETDGVGAMAIGAFFCCIFFITEKLINKYVNRFTIMITHTNDEYYQFRFLTDNRLCILGGANFDENDEIIGTGGIMEMDPIFSDLFMVEKIKSIRVGDEGLHMTCDAKVRQYRINDGNRKYYEYVDKQHLSIYMQPGTFSEEMLECLDKMYSNSEMITPD